MLSAALDARASAMKAAPVKMENVLFIVFSFTGGIASSVWPA
jgi:hypothetical protein